MENNISPNFIKFEKCIYEAKQSLETVAYHPADFFEFLNYICNKKIIIDVKNTGFFEIKEHIVGECSIFFDTNGVFIICNNKNEKVLQNLKGTGEKTGKYVTKDHEIIDFFKSQHNKLKSIKYNKDYSVADSKYISQYEPVLRSFLFGDGEPVFEFKSNEDMTSFFVETWKIVDCMEVIQKDKLIVCKLSVLGIFYLAFTPGSLKIILSGGGIPNKDLKNMVNEMLRTIKKHKLPEQKILPSINKKIDHNIIVRNEVANASSLNIDIKNTNSENINKSQEVNENISKIKKNTEVVKKFKTFDQMKQYVQLLKMNTKFNICGFTMEGGIVYENKIKNSDNIYYYNYNMNDDGEFVVGINKNTKVVNVTSNELKTIVCLRKFKTFDRVKDYLQLLNLDCKFTMCGYEENGGVVYQMSVDEKLYNAFYILNMDGDEYTIIIRYKVNIYN